MVGGRILYFLVETRKNLRVGAVTYGHGQPLISLILLTFNTCYLLTFLSPYSVFLTHDVFQFVAKFPRITWTLATRRTIWVVYDMSTVINSSRLLAE